MPLITPHGVRGGNSKTGLIVVSEVAQDFFTSTGIAAGISLSGTPVNTATRTGAAAYTSVRGLTGRASGKYVYAITWGTITVDAGYGICDSTELMTKYPGQTIHSQGCWHSGNTYYNAISGGNGMQVNTGNTSHFAVDFAANKIWFGTNNVWSGDPGAGTGGLTLQLTGTLYPMVCVYDNGQTALGKAEPTDYPYTKPTGFLEWGKD